MIFPSTAVNGLSLSEWCQLSTNELISVARVAYLTSDIVLSVQPALQTDSLFSKSLKALKASKTQNVLSKGAPEVCDSNRSCQLGQR